MSYSDNPWHLLSTFEGETNNLVDKARKIGIPVLLAAA